MATYEYLCGTCGRFDVRLAMGTAPEQTECPTCAGAARRAFSPPRLGVGTPSSVRRVVDMDERSQDAPEVVSRVPSKAGNAPPYNPALARLPKP